MLQNTYRLGDKDLDSKLFIDIGNAPGVYRLFCMDKGMVKPVPRVLGVDVEGRLYIGKGDNLRKRVLQLRSRIFHSRTKHSGGSRYNSNEKLNMAFPREQLYIQLYTINSPKLEEERLLFEYIKLFGELPPLNRKR
ncbi:hypothetical protein [Flagellimonas pacifica]|uniref:GIY-YIG domain-containing protein n=1 Tax=Flagellimonas pacifica TaxID=1247520 RepID=A0A285MQU4_9FLAO|nr:hypothetical protein [Allomuricauda parva]SNY99552.1 hypothetical protein SAMN06265377_1363 [Allomuricauda parva]